jgi:transcriptional regulator with XRE-family HTH domain
MGYRGKVGEQQRARELRAQAWTLAEIAAELGVSRSSASVWVRDVPFDEAARAERAGANRQRGARRRGPNALARRKQDEIDRLLAEGRERIGRLSERDLLIAGTALYAGEGAKADGSVVFANSDVRLVVLFLRFLRHYFEVDESRLRVRVYLHAGLDLDAATRFWSQATGIPVPQFGKPYRAVPDASIRHSKHLYGCAYVKYSCAATHRAIMGLMAGLLA